MGIYCYFLSVDSIDLYLYFLAWMYLILAQGYPCKEDSEVCFLTIYRVLHFFHPPKKITFTANLFETSF